MPDQGVRHAGGKPNFKTERDAMKIKIITSGPTMTDCLLEQRQPDVVYPELDWVHPKTRLAKLADLVGEGKDIVMATWDELSFLVALAASAEHKADVEVEYWTTPTESMDIKVSEGSLEHWPDPDGFFSERSKAIFSNGLFEGSRQ